MKLQRNTGWIVSAVAHGALLAGFIFALPDARKFTDAQETVPVEIMTREQFNQVVKGDKQAKQQLPDQRADNKADDPESNPKPPIAEARKNIPTPPPPLQRQSDPGEDDAPKPVEPAPKIAALPPPRPERKTDPEPAPQPAPVPPVRPRPAKVIEPKPAAEPPRPIVKQALTPAPPMRPKVEPKPKPEPKKIAAVEPEKPQVEPPEKVEPQVPLPPRRPRYLPRATAKPKPQPRKVARLQTDSIAKLLEDKKRTGAARVRPKSGNDDNDPRKKFDTTAISRLLSKENAQRRASAGRKIQRQARLGSPTASAAKMSPSMWGQLDGLMQEQYKRCWSYLGLASGRRYIPQVRVSYAPSGRLASQPTLLNPPADPAMRSLAESALRAVRKCDPLRIPAQFLPFHNQWKSRVLRFDPEEMMG